MTTQIALGETMKITGVTTPNKPAGYLHQIGGFVGVVLNDIIGTSVAFVSGAALGQSLTDGFGDGEGDMALEGVWETLIASGIVIAVGAALYYDGSNHDRVSDSSGGHFAGHCWPQDDGAATRAVAAGDPSWMLSATPAFVVIRCRLLGHPKTGLV